MGELVIVRGDVKNKPVASEQLANIFENLTTVLEGTLYVGYPIIGTTLGGFQIDALLITKQTGLFVFNIIEGNNHINYQNVQDENYSKLQSKLILHNDLMAKRSLDLDINTITFAPAWNTPSLEKGVDEVTYPCITTQEELLHYFKQYENQNNSKHFSKILSVLQSITSIRNNKSREYIIKENSRGAKLKKIEDSIANLDRNQSRAVIETVEGVQRIRGLAGSGKTIILALKVAYLHSKNPDWKIAVTFNTRSLKEQFKKYINVFCYEHQNAEPNWDNIDVIHAWGTYKSVGIYYNLCKDHNIDYLDFKDAKKIVKVYGQEFQYVCSKVLNEGTQINTKYDLIVVDEAQDFSKDFLNICYQLVHEPKRLVYAYDELQSLNDKTMPSPEEIFGNDKDGKPLIKLENLPKKPKEDIILFKCYRNPIEILTSAHALGFGLYRTEMVQMFNDSSLWKEIGYELEGTNIVEGEPVLLKRTNDTSPDFLSSHSEQDDIVSFKSFDHNSEQVEFVVSQIIKNINEDELKLDDIMVINTNPLTTKSVVGSFRDILYKNKINSSLAGVTSSPDIFFNGDTITFTGIHRAKGNEAAMVYIINAQYCYKGLELAKKRNILFTGMTRSKAWVRVCGYGKDMRLLEDEFNKVKEKKFQLDFIYPTEQERRQMNIVNRDRSNEEKENINEATKHLTSFINGVEKGIVGKEDISIEVLNKLKQIIDDKKNNS